MQKRPIEIDDLFNIQMLGDPNISPDGQRVAYVTTFLDEQANAYRSSIWMVGTAAGSEPARFTRGPRQDWSPRWSPDGQLLAFLSNRGGNAQIHVTPVNGGEGWSVTATSNPVSEFRWMPDGKSLLLVTRDEPESASDRDTVVVDSLAYKMDGIGLLGATHQRIHLVDVMSGEMCRVAAEIGDATQPVPSPDGRRVAYKLHRDADRESHLLSDIWITDLHTGKAHCVTPADGVYATPSWSPDGQRLACTGYRFEPFGRATQSDLHVWTIETGRHTTLLESLDREPGRSTLTDMGFHAATPIPVWSDDSACVLSLVSDAGGVHICQCPIDGEPTPVVAGNRDIQSFTMSGNGSIAFASSSMTAPTEIFVAQRDSAQRQVTFANADFLSTIDLAEPEEVRFESEPGVNVHGWLIKPPAMDPPVKYPAIVQVHGGPHSMYGTGFFHEMQVLAGKGYVVLMTNPRSSTGYGQEWLAGSLGDWGGADYRDIMAGVSALDALGFVDSERIGITGTSYGGYMTNWAITQSDRFRAAVTQNSSSNRFSLYGTADWNMMYNDWEFGGSPYDIPEFYMERSPIAHMRNVQTPLLILHAENDMRCPISQAEELFVALRTFGKTVQLVRFPNETHSMSRIGQPVHRRERLERICAWFHRYLVP